MLFDFEAYSKECSTLTPEQLQREWEAYTRIISSAATGTTFSILAAPFTLGLSVAGTAVGASAIHNARKKRDIIEFHLKMHGKTHNTRIVDVVGGVPLAATVKVLSGVSDYLGIDEKRR